MRACTSRVATSGSGDKRRYHEQNVQCTYNGVLEAAATASTEHMNSRAFSFKISVEYTCENKRLKKST
nr:hypothetical protein CFP56_71058 [Quercus suber]